LLVVPPVNGGNEMNSIGVLIVDDSAVVREVIGDAIRSQSGMHVVGTASDGRRALELVAQLQSDVVTLDVLMPQLDGLQTLDGLLAVRPVPVVMVSGLTQAGAETTLAALDRGAMDYVAKPESGVPRGPGFLDELIRKIRAVAGVDVRRMLQIRRERAERQKLKAAAGPIVRSSPPSARDVPLSYRDACIALGISTGGPPALATLFAGLRTPLPPLAVVQHMPPGFTASLAKRLDALTPLEVKEAADGDEMLPNRVLLAPGGKHMQLRRRAGRIVTTIIDGEPVSGHRPSVDVLMQSAAELYGRRTVGLIMTGMGRDGVAGCAAVRAAGGFVLGQDEASSDVYGMNKAAFVDGHVDRQFSLDDAALVLLQTVEQRFAGKSC
jgi:two-component system chemotaxis response regulator CheB